MKDHDRLSFHQLLYGSWWGDNDDELSVKTIQKAIDLGIKWIDTAPIYGLYHSEDVVGKAIKGKRDQEFLPMKRSPELQKNYRRKRFTFVHRNYMQTGRNFS